MVPFLFIQFKSAALIRLSLRDRDLLLLLERTPATPLLIVKASETFAGGPFRDERRARERLQALSDEGLARSWSLAQPGGGVTKYYKITPAGFTALFGDEAALPPRAYFRDIPLARLEHTLSLAEAIVHTFVTAHDRRVQITKFHRENELTLSAGQYTQQPDCHLQFRTGGKTFNVLFELDRSTESVDSYSQQSIRQKILGYEEYQDFVWHQWKRGEGQPPRPYFRVAFLTLSIERAYHILALARDLAGNPRRRLCYATPLDSYLASSDAVREPLFLDHLGGWQSLVNLHPTATPSRTPVRLPRHVQSTSML
jgi:hypothetical protein